MKLPQYIRVGAFQFELRRNKETDHMLEANGHYGQFSSHQMIIYIRSEMIAQKSVDTLLHECLHAIYWVYTLKDDDNEEHLCRAISSALVALHFDNRWLSLFLEQCAKQPVEWIKL